MTDGRTAEGRDTPLAMRLRLLTGLEEDDLDALAALFAVRQQMRARRGIGEGESGADRLHVLLDGWACRFRLMPEGRRQITALLLPGDICDLEKLYFGRLDGEVATLTPCSVATMGLVEVRMLAAARPRVAAALGRLTAVDNAMLAERNASLGRRSAREHLIHLICELAVRLAAVGRPGGSAFVLPITQEEIADVLGLTAVHVNRTLSTLRADRLIEQTGQLLRIRDWRALRRSAGFDAAYLHFAPAAALATDRSDER